MSKKSRKDSNPWERFMLWAEENQKVIWVVLLALLAPTFAFTIPYRSGSQQDDIVMATVFGRSVTQGEYKRLAERFGAVREVLLSAAVVEYPLPPPLGASGISWMSLGGGSRQDDALDPIGYFAMLQEAENLGIRVSDSELRRCIWGIWQRREALERAKEEVYSQPNSPGDPTGQFKQYQVPDAAKKKFAELQVGDGSYFDKDSWRKMIERGDQRRDRAALREFEETLREVCTIAKLEDFVTSSVQVSQKEVFDEYNKQDQKRKLSWVEVKLPDALKEKVASSLGPDELKNHYETEKQAFAKALSIRARWLLVPKDHYRSEVEKKLTDEDLKKHYEDNRGKYRRPAILANEGSFTLRTAEEQAAFEKEAYKSFEEAREDVRKEVIESRTAADLRSVADQVRNRLYPPKPRGDATKTIGDKPPPATFEDLVKEYPALKTGTTDYVQKEDTKTKFGDAYTPQVDSWFAMAGRGKPVTPSEAPLSNEKGQVFYSRVETRAANFVPRLTEIEGEVRDRLVKSKALALIEKALTATSEEVNTGKKDFAAVGTEGIDVEVGGEKVHVPAGAVESSGTYLVRRGSIMVPKPPKPEAEKEDAGKKPEAGMDDNGEAGDMQAHASSSVIVTGGFNLLEGEKQKTRAASDSAAGSCFLVRLEDIQLPNPADFKKEQESLERRIAQERRVETFGTWRKGLLRRARPSDAAGAVDAAKAASPDPAKA